MRDANLISEAEIFGKYIIGSPINKEVVDFYYQSINKNPINGNAKETYLLEKCIKKPYLLPYYDAALSIQDPEHLIKRRLIRMFAILETRTEYADLFLGRKFTKLYLLKIAWIGIRAVLKTAVGIIIIRF